MPTLRDKLFVSYSLLSIVILVAAVWVVGLEAAAQSRQEILEEMKTALPLYNAVWEEQAGRLSMLELAMAGSPIVKAVFGDPRAARDRETLRQMLSEFGKPLTENVDVILISDGGGTVLFLEGHSAPFAGIDMLTSARSVAADQKPAQCFDIFGNKLFHLALTPVVSHSSNADFNNTLAVLVAGSELNRDTALELKRRAHSDVLFFKGDRLYASSLDPEAEADAAGTVPASKIADGNSTMELSILGASQLAFAQPLNALDGRRIGYVVVLRSLRGVAKLFYAISDRLLLVVVISMVLVLLVSYFVARRITRPVESLAAGARELGCGNYEYRIDLSPDGEIGQLAAAFDQMRRSIQRGQADLRRSERLATVGQMAGGIIHDLRGPLATISTAAELFGKAELTRDQRETLIRSQLLASQRMGAMLRDILEFSRGAYELHLERVELRTFVHSIIRETIKPEMSPQITVQVDIAPHLSVRIDCAQARRIFDNLLTNAIQAMPEGGAVTVRAIETGDRVQIYVADTGAGIPAPVRDRIFEPFVSQGKRGGTGLGLAVASSIAKAHSGSLTLVSGAGQPAEFCLELPVYREERDAGQGAAC